MLSLLKKKCVDWVVTCSNCALGNCEASQSAPVKALHILALFLALFLVLVLKVAIPATGAKMSKWVCIWACLMSKWGKPKYGWFPFGCPLKPRKEPPFSRDTKLSQTAYVSTFRDSGQPCLPKRVLSCFVQTPEPADQRPPF